MEGVIILHETIHEMHRKKLDGVILKLDFEKAYDKVKWSFLQQTLRMKGFSPLWCKWIDQIVRGGSVGIKVNDILGHYFQPKKGLRQGDPLSPILFNLVADMLATLIGRAKSDGRFQGVIPHLVDDGLSILQYADDTILFMDHDLLQAKDLKLVLSTFEQLSGLKINFHKSELFCYGSAKDCEHEYAQLFGCKTGGLPFKYLGIPLHHRKLSNKDWAIIEERFQKKLSSWKGKLLSVGGRLVLINSVLTSLAMYMLSFFEVPKGVLQKLDFYRSRFFWQSDSHKKKYRLTKWSVLCRPKDCGGLGIQNLGIQNKCLLSKWLFKLINEDGVWQNLLRRKYLTNKAITQVYKRPGDSHFWSGLMKVKDDFLAHGYFRIQKGTQVRFWEDIWLGNKPLRDVYPSLYRIVRKKNDTVAKVLASTPLDVSFRRGLVEGNLTAWYDLVSKVVTVNLTKEKDVFVWNLHRSGSFTVRSMYLNLIQEGVLPTKNPLWKIRVPLKIKIFLWYLQKGVTLTKDNLAKRNWQGSVKCCFCNSLETIQHLFIDCHFARFIWNTVHITFGIHPPSSISDMFGSWLHGIGAKLKNQILLGAVALCWAMWLNRNDVVFNNAKTNTFLQVIFRATYWIRHWSLLSKEEERPIFKNGCQILETVIMEVFAKFGWKFRNRIEA